MLTSYITISLQNEENNVGTSLLTRQRSLFGIHQFSHQHPLSVPGCKPASTLHLEVLYFC